MLRKPIVLIDSDGVMSNFCESALEFVHKHSGSKRYSQDDIVHWDILRNFGLEHLENEFTAHIGSSQMCLNMQVFDGVSEALAQLRSIADVHCVTAPHHAISWPGERMKWLQTRLGFDKQHVHQTHAKWMVTGDVFVDDSGKNCIEMARHHPDRLVYLWAQPYNAADELLPNITRTADWSVVIGAVKRLAGA